MTADTAPLALVTGGHRRLGARIAMHLASAGYALAIHGRNDVEPHPFLAERLTETGVAWKSFLADFLVPGEAEALVPAVIAHFGPAPVLLTQAFARAERPAGAQASIVNILDQRLAQPHGDQLAYTLGKYALEGFTRVAARELAPAIRVNAVAPGLTLATDDYSETQLGTLTARMPLAHLPSSEDVADAVLYLARASSVTGQTLYVDAGAHMRNFPRDFMHL